MPEKQDRRHVPERVDTSMICGQRALDAFSGFANPVKRSSYV